MNTLTSIGAFILAIGLLVTIHEFGHFWVARRLGVKVLRFSIGFGRPLWSRVAADGVEYVIAAIPLGGYVKMLDEREGPVEDKDLSGAFNRKSLWVRTAVVAAGPVFNFVFAVFAYWIVFNIGVSGLAAYVGDVEDGSPAHRAGLRSGAQIIGVDDRPTSTWMAVIQRTLGGILDADSMALEVRSPSGATSQLKLAFDTLTVDDLTEGRFFRALGVTPFRPLLPATIERTEPDGAAHEGGLQRGDTVVAVGGKPVEGWSHWVQTVQASAGKPLITTVIRDATRRQLTITPRSVERDGKKMGFIGAQVQQHIAGLDKYYVVERYGPSEAFTQALDKTWEVSTLTLQMFWKMLRLEVSLDNLSGPITIARYAGDSARSGPVRFFEFLAIVSVSLGILNLLPIPVLDGGHLLYFAVEAVKGSPMSDQAQYVGQHLGLMMLVGLMSLAFYNDIARLLG
jgi:regulator of sigma E protease